MPLLRPPWRTSAGRREELFPFPLNKLVFLFSAPFLYLSFSFSCFRFSWECSRRIDKLKRALINSKSWTFTWIMFFDPFFWIFSNANIISICSCLCYVDVPWHSWTSYMIGPSMHSLRSLTQGHSTLVEKNGLPWASSELRSNEERVEWWRCRESNPGPTCRASVHTVMSILDRSTHKDRTKSK